MRQLARKREGDSISVNANCFIFPRVFGVPEDLPEDGTNVATCIDIVKAAKLCGVDPDPDNIDPQGGGLTFSAILADKGIKVETREGDGPEFDLLQYEPLPDTLSWTDN